MSDLLGIGSSGIGVAQQALSTVSNNIANLSTDGYSRQTTEIRQAQPKDVGNGYIGTGAYFDGVARQYRAILADGARNAALARVTTPLLVIHGADDPLVPLAGGEDTAASVPGSELEVIAGMGHDLPEALAERIVDRVSTFFAG